MNKPLLLETPLPNSVIVGERKGRRPMLLNWAMHSVIQKLRDRGVIVDLPEPPPMFLDADD